VSRRLSRRHRLEICADSASVNFHDWIADYQLRPKCRVDQVCAQGSFFSLNFSTNQNVIKGAQVLI